VLSRNIRPYLVFVLILLAAGAVSVLLGQDSNCDLYSYHIYNPYAFLTGRLGQDFLAGGLQSYANPLPDIPYYLMLKYLNTHPLLVAFIQGFYYGALCFFVYLISFTVLKPETKRDFIFPCLAFLIGVTNVFLVSEAGTNFNDITVGIFILLAFYILIKNLFEPESKKRTILIFLSGLLFGVITGFKLTAAIFVIGIILSVLCSYKKIAGFKKILAILLFGCIAGFLLTNGWWMYLVYSQYKNPFFPFFNSIFQSEYYPLESIRDARFLPSDLSRWLFYPFYWISFSTKTLYGGYAAELPFIDLRYAFCYLSVLLLAGLNLFSLFKKKDEGQGQQTQNFLVLFIVFSYVIWLSLFSILRYFIPCACLTGIIIMLAIKELFLRMPQNRRFIGVVVAVLITLVTLFCVKYISWGRGEYSSEILTPPDLKIADNSIVFLNRGSQMAMMSYLIPFQNPNAHYIGILLDKDTTVMSEPDNIYEKMADKYVNEGKINKFYLLIDCDKTGLIGQIKYFRSGKFKCVPFEEPRKLRESGACMCESL